MRTWWIPCQVFGNGTRNGKKWQGERGEKGGGGGGGGCSSLIKTSLFLSSFLPARRRGGRKLKNIGAFFSLFPGENWVGPQSILTDAYFFLCASCVDFFPTTTHRFPLKKVEEKKTFFLFLSSAVRFQSFQFSGLDREGFFSGRLDASADFNFPDFFGCVCHWRRRNI